MGTEFPHKMDWVHYLTMYSHALGLIAQHLLDFVTQVFGHVTSEQTFLLDLIVNFNIDKGGNIILVALSRDQDIRASGEAANDIHVIPTGNEDLDKAS